MNELALFAGAGGGILGGILCGFRCVGAVEIDPYCREVLLRRQEEEILPPFPIWDDIRTFDGHPWRGVVDIVTAGFPCQPFSVAGKRKGKDDERNMWPDTIRTLREVEPRYALLENVPGLVRTDYFGTIIGDLAEAGYDAEWEIVSAAEVGAPHLRKRLWILANSQSTRIDNIFIREANIGDGCKTVADAQCAGLERWKQSKTTRTAQPIIRCRSWWRVEPKLGRVADGVAYWVDRLRAIGNGQVPAVVREAWRLLARGNHENAISG